MVIPCTPDMGQKRVSSVILVASAIDLMTVYLPPSNVVAEG